MIRKPGPEALKRLKSFAADCSNGTGCRMTLVGITENSVHARPASLRDVVASLRQAAGAMVLAIAARTPRSWCS